MYVFWRNASLDILQVTLTQYTTPEETTLSIQIRNILKTLFSSLQKQYILIIDPACQEGINYRCFSI